MIELKIGKWEEELKKLTCPYCFSEFKPRVFSNLSIKQCPVCHRYFILPRNLVLKLVSNRNNMSKIKAESRKIGLSIERKTDREIQNHIIKLIENGELYWDTRGWFLTSKRDEAI